MWDKAWGEEAWVSQAHGALTFSGREVAERDLAENEHRMSIP
jgi:hypothetical protein